MDLDIVNILWFDVNTNNVAKESGTVRAGIIHAYAEELNSIRLRPHKVCNAVYIVENLPIHRGTTIYDEFRGKYNVCMWIRESVPEHARCFVVNNGYGYRTCLKKLMRAYSSADVFTKSQRIYMCLYCSRGYINIDSTIQNQPTLLRRLFSRRKKYEPIYTLFEKKDPDPYAPKEERRSV